MLGDKGSGLLLEGKSYIVHEIDVNFFRLSHKMTCYCPAVVHQSTQIYLACSTSTEKNYVNLCKVKYVQSDKQSVVIMWLIWQNNASMS